MLAEVPPSKQTFLSSRCAVCKENDNTPQESWFIPTPSLAQRYQTEDDEIDQNDDDGVWNNFYDLLNE